MAMVIRRLVKRVCKFVCVMGCGFVCLIMSEATTILRLLQLSI